MASVQVPITMTYDQYQHLSDFARVRGLQVSTRLIRRIIEVGLAVMEKDPTVNLENLK